MRYLHFTVENKKFYELCQQGSISTSREITVKRGEARTYDKLCIKLEDIGTKGDNGLLELLADTTVALEDSEFDLLVDCLEQVKWTAAGVREAYKMIEWIKESPTKPTLTAD